MFVLLYEAVQIFTSIVLYPGLGALGTQLGSNLASQLKAHESCQLSRVSTVAGRLPVNYCTHELTFCIHSRACSLK